MKSCFVNIRNALYTVQSYMNSFFFNPVIHRLLRNVSITATNLNHYFCIHLAICNALYLKCHMY